MIDQIEIKKADAFAERAHSGHTRSNRAKGPYINHLREVAELVAESGGATQEICAALLHDSVEDTETTVEDIIVNFGNKVGQLIYALTDDPASNKLPTLERKTLQAEHVKHANLSVKRIKLADQISNVLCVITDPPMNWDTQKCIDYIEGTKRIAFECREVSEFLDRKYSEVYEKAVLKCNL